MSVFEGISLLRQRVTVSVVLLIGGYLRLNYKSNIPVEIFYSIMAYWYIHNDSFAAFKNKNRICWISHDQKTLCGCAYGQIRVDPSNTTFNNYQWLIQINALDDYSVVFGITSKRAHRYPWWQNDFNNRTQFNFHSFECEEDLNFHSLVDPKYFQLYEEFEEGDMVVLDLNITNRSVSLIVNWKLVAKFENINIDVASYYLGIDTVCSSDFVSLISYSQFNNKVYAQTISKSIYDYSLTLQNKVNPALKQYASPYKFTMHKY
eukprot:502228_1